MVGGRAGGGPAEVVPDGVAAGAADPHGLPGGIGCGRGLRGAQGVGMVGERGKRTQQRGRSVRAVTHAPWGDGRFTVRLAWVFGSLEEGGWG